MNACRAHWHSPVHDLSSSPANPAVFPPSIVPPSLPWRPPPHSCDIANPSFLGPSTLQDTSAPQDARAKSTPPLDHHRPAIPYPSPPLTDAALASTVPLPELPGEPSRHPSRESDCEDLVHETMSHDGARHIAPLSPPPTQPVSFKELPSGDEFQDGGHHIEMWRYGDADSEVMQDGGAQAAFFPPVRDDSGFEEFDPLGEGRKSEGTHHGGLIEPTSMFSVDSPLCIDDFPLDHLPTFNSALSGGPADDRNSGHADVLASPISLSDAEGQTDGWASGSEMDWTSSPTSTFVDHLSAPSSPKPGCLSLDLPPFDSPLGFQPHAPFSHLQQPSPVSPHEIPFGQHHPHWFSGDAYHSQQPTPLAEDHSPFMSSFFHSGVQLHPPPAVDIDAEYPDTVMPPEDDDELLPPPSPRRRLNDLHDAVPPHDDVCPTPVPRSPRSPHFSLPDYDSDMEDESLSEAPSSPHSPHPDLPELEDDLPLPGLPLFPDMPPIETISPSLLGGAPEPQPQDPGLGLFLQPLSDPPLMRSPSPDEDDFGFLDIQLDPESVNVEIDEFLQLRALRKHVLAQERAARMAEADLTERITAAASAFLPTTSSRPSSSCGSESEPESDDGDVQMQSELDPAEKRMRKRELHTMMDMRAEARRARKLQKQRSKEIGALLDFKMHPPSSPLVMSGKSWTRTVYHLLAHMMMRRRDRAAKPLESKPPDAHSLVRKPSRLRMSVSAEDLVGEVAADEDDDMEMI